MDYCSTCRRHLNGALVCPGCGAYAPDIAPLPGGAPALIATATAAPVHDEPVPYRYAEGPADTPDESFDAATASGRAARRRQRERWKKTQRRALVATAVALVGGGLTVSSMSRQSTDRTQAASAPDREPMGVAEEEVGQPTAPESAPSDA
ncbi:SCO2400 family protein, partial [Streptomyces sp. S6]